MSEAQLQVPPASAWRKPREQGYTVRLPSGNVATLRPVAVDVLLLSGKLPDLLSPIVAKTLWAETEPATLADQAELSKGFAELVNIVTRASMLNPRIVDEPSADDEIGLEDIDFSDKLAIFQLATGGSAVLQKFLEQQAASVEPVRDGESDNEPTE